MAYRDVILAETGLVSYWQLDEAAGSISLADQKGTNTLAVSGTGTVLGGSGVGSLTGTSMSLNGSGWGQTSGAPAGVPTGAAAVSFECWFKTTASFTAWVALMMYGNEATNQKAGLYITANGGNKQLTWSFFANDLTITLSQAFNDGYWHHLVGTYDGTTRNLYYDGALLGTDTPTAPSIQLGAHLYVGSDDGTQHFNGSMDEVAIYSVALTGTQVSNHYGATGTNPNARTTQVVGETLVSATQANARVSQVVTETLVVPTQANARISQVVVEALVTPTNSNALVSQEVIEVAVTSLPGAIAEGQTIIIK